MKPIDLATELGIPANRLRSYLRARYPRNDGEHGTGWSLTASQVEELRRSFGSGATTVSPDLPRVMATPPASLVNSGLYHDEWYWEGNVQDAACRQLVANGWTIVRTARTARKERGDDSLATKSGIDLSVEVKGYPSIGYADAQRVGETKASKPTIQAEKWFAAAILKSVRILGTRPNVHVAIALPDFVRYRRLFEDVREPLARLGIQVLWITEEDVQKSREAVEVTAARQTSDK